MHVTIGFIWRRVVKLALALCLVSVLGRPASAQTQPFDWRFAGMVFDAFTLDGQEFWTVEDGGRIRHRDPVSGTWTFQVVPDEVKDTLRRVHFQSNGMTGWAVGLNGYVIKTTNGGSTWSVFTQMRTDTDCSTPGTGAFEELYDIHFMANGLDGWIAGLHNLWYTTNGGTSWCKTMLTNTGGAPLDPATIELYALDVVPGPGPTEPFFGLAVAEPGYVLRTTDGVGWQVKWKIQDQCGTGVLVGCEFDVCVYPNPPKFEPWDVEISRHPSQKLALMGGGIGNQCGLIFSSTDGISWTKEYHECQCTGAGCLNCTVDPLYHCPIDPNPTPKRLCTMRTIYGLGFFHGDNSAIACGYNGQHLVRDNSTSPARWRDRSSFSGSIPHPPGAVKFPLLGAASNSGTAATGKGLFVGLGGNVRRSTDGGQTWTADFPDDPHRLEDVFFRSDSHGWAVGQLSRIAKTEDSGTSWTEQFPKPAGMAPSLRAVTFASTSDRGVTVGGPFLPPGATRTQPKILWTDTAGVQAWQTPSTIIADSAFMDLKELREVDWAGDAGFLDFWAAGQGGLILHTTNGGDLWRQFPPPLGDPTFYQFEIEGVAFHDPSRGIFVGRRPDPNALGAIRGAAYEYEDDGQGNITWTQLLMPVGVTVLGLTDIDIVGNDAYAVGEKQVGTAVQGVLIRSTLGMGYGGFSEVTGPSGGFPDCTIGDVSASFPVLSEVDIAPGGHVWVSGKCGRVWKLASSTWTELKSQTSNHVVGQSFVPGSPSGYVGFLGSFRSGQGQHCVVRVVQP